MLAPDGAAALKLLVDRDPAMVAAVGAGAATLDKVAVLELAQLIEQRDGARVAYQELVVLLARPGVEFEAKDQVVQAVAWYLKGVPLSQALHLAAHPPRSRPITLDPSRVAAAQRAGTSPNPVLALVEQERSTQDPAGSDGLEGLDRWVALRMRMGLTRSALAALIGVDPGQVAQWEEGHSAPTGDVLALLERMG